MPSVASRQAGGAAAPPKLDREALSSDVRAFAAQLGLTTPAAGGGSGFDDRDFLPQKAKQPLAAARANSGDKQRNAAVSKHAAAAPKAPAVRKLKRHRDDNIGDEQADTKRQQRDQETPVKRKGRDWNTGVGPRPGAATGKSLQTKDEHQVWFEALAALPPLPEPTSASGWPPADDVLVEQRRAHCEALIENEAVAFERQMGRRSAADARWLQQVKSAGTTQDKVAAMTLLVRESAVANLKSVDQLLSWVQKRSGGREVVRQAIEALQELFLTVLLPGRKLKTLGQQPLAAVTPGIKEGDRQLLYWFMEDAIKKRYNLFVTALEECSRDNLEFLKEKATKTMYDLLVKKPEAEARLLSGLVNKLGDPNRKVASKAGFLLSQLLLEHPVMKPVVVREVEKFLFRSGLQDRGRYYAVTFLNQLALSHRESEGGGGLAKKLIDIYFTLFKMLVDGHIGRAAAMKKIQDVKYENEKKKFRYSKNRGPSHSGAAGGRGTGGRGARPALQYPVAPEKPMTEEMDARMLGALIAGVRRAFPYVPSEDVEPLIDCHSEHLYRMVHTAPFSVGLQALLLMFQLLAGREAVSDRFYRALYAVLLLPDGPVNSTRAPMFLALLFKAMKADVSVKRLAAFSKRLLQVLKSQPALWSAILQPEEYDEDGLVAAGSAEGSAVRAEGRAAAVKQRLLAAEYDSGDDECDSVALPVAKMPKHAPNRPVKLSTKPKQQAWDDDESGDEELAGSELEAPALDAPGAVTSTLNGTGSRAARAATRWPPAGHYDMEKREPLYCHAERSCWWELSVLAGHAHPSVAAMARTLLAGSPIVYDGDPTRDHGLAAFLDKFLQKKPKSHARGASLMQPMPNANINQQASAGVVGSKAFAALAEANVAPADLFFHKFYNLQSIKARQQQKQAIKAAKAELVDEDVALLGGSGAVIGEADEEHVDRFLEGVEGVGDDAMGNPELGYDYEGLAIAMARGELEDATVGDEDAGGSGVDEDAACEGATEQSPASSSEDDDAASEGTVSGSEDGEFEQDDSIDGGAGSADELAGLNLNDLPSPSASDELDNAAKQPHSGKTARSGKTVRSAAGRRKAAAEAKTFEFSDSSDDEGEDSDGDLAAMFAASDSDDD